MDSSCRPQAGHGRRALSILLSACLVVTILTLTTPASASTPDNFASRETIVALPFSTSVDTSSATEEDGEPNPTCAFDSSKTVWYQYTPGSDMTLAAHTTGSSFETVVGVWTGTSLGGLSPVACRNSSSTSRSVFAASSGVTYLFQVGGFGANSGNLQFHLQSVTGPPNDRFAQATPITSAQLPFTDPDVDTTNASIEAGEPFESPPCGYQIGATSWYSFTPSSNGTVVISTGGSSYNTTLVVYSGSTLGGLTKLGCNDDYSNTTQSRVTMPVNSGTPYKIQVGGYAHETGSMDFELRLASPPVNDAFANRITIPDGPYSDTRDTSEASLQVGEQQSTCGHLNSASVWYQFNAPVSESIVVDTAGSSYDTVISAWTGTTLGSLSHVACNDNVETSRARLVMEVTGGTNYIFQVTGYIDSSGSLQLAFGRSGTNDAFASSRVIAPTNGRFVDHRVTTGYGIEPSEPGPGCGESATIASTAWYTYTAPYTGQVRVDLSGTQPDIYSILEVFEGSSVGTLNRLSCHQSPFLSLHPNFLMNVEQGSVYRIRVGGGSVPGATPSGTVQMRLNEKFAVTVGTTGGASGVVTSDPPGIDCGETCTTDWQVGSTMTLTATPDDPDNAVFAGWSEGSPCSGYGSECSFNVVHDATVIAEFEPATTLTMALDGPGVGTIADQYGSFPHCTSASDPCQQTHPQNRSLTFSAVPETGSVFMGWSGACTGTNPTCTFSMTSDRSLTATFSAMRSLTVSKGGAGSGTVSSAPAGIDCGVDCDHEYLHGTGVTLSAAPDSSSVFSGWSVACTGKGQCMVPMTGATSVNASFAPKKSRPDGSISLGSGPFVGNNVYNSTGASQNRTAKGRRNRSKTFTVKVQNDGNYKQDLLVLGSAASGAFTVRYMAGTTNATKKVVAGTYKLAKVAPGATRSLKLIIGVKRSARIGAIKKVLISTIAATNALLRDTVKAQLKVVR